MPAKKKPAAKKAAPKYASQKDYDALLERVLHLEAVLVRRFGFEIASEPTDIVKPEATA